MICLVRHGETEWNLHGRIQGKTDIPLNDTGRKQARECREFLKDSEFDALVSSPLIRARETADIINTSHQLPVIEMDAFKERSFGKAEGLTEEERTQYFPSKKYPGQENEESFRERVMDGIAEVSSLFPKQKVLLVAHGAVISMILSTLSKGEIDSGKMRLVNACISNIEQIEEEWKIHDYNQITHLSVFN